MQIDEIWDGIANNIKHLKEASQYNMRIGFAAGVAAAAAEVMSLPLYEAALRIAPELEGAWNEEQKH
jgi:hypothetical protein